MTCTNSNINVPETDEVVVTLTNIEIFYIRNILLVVFRKHPTRQTSTAVSETTSAAFSSYFYYISRFWGSLPCCACSYQGADSLILQKETDVTWVRIPIHDKIFKFSFQAWTTFSFSHLSALIINIVKANFGGWKSRQILFFILNNQRIAQCFIVKIY